jgi:hypothetical protein
VTVNVRPHSERQPLLLEQAEYDRLTKRAQGGWSQCADETEWLAKLHYLRQGLEDGKLTPAQFEERETRLVTGWLRQRL